MTLERILHAVKSQPFRPFSLHLADGRVFSVPHPEYLAVVGKGRMVVVTDPQSEDLEIIDLLLVSSLSIAGQAA